MRWDLRFTTQADISRLFLSWKTVWRNTAPWGMKPAHLRLRVTPRLTLTATDGKAGPGAVSVHVKGKEGSGFMLEFFCRSSKGLKAVRGKAKCNSSGPGPQRKQSMAAQQRRQRSNGLPKWTPQPCPPAPPWTVPFQVINLGQSSTD